MERQLAALAAAYGVATWYEDSDRRRHEVARETVVRVLGLLGVDASTPDAVRDGVTAARIANDPRRLPPTVVVRAGLTRALPATAEVILEDGTRRSVGDTLPDDLPLGWHRLACGDQDVTLVVVPRRLPVPPHTWGWMLQLYALRSRGSWGMGDLGDLAEFTRWAGRDAGFVLLNPLHAVVPTHPVPASPYSPSSRRFANPLYLRVEATKAFRNAPADLRARVLALRPDERDLIDYDEVWAAKRAALELLFPLTEDADPATDPGVATDPVVASDPDLDTFALYCALAERHGADWRTWPSGLRRNDMGAVAAARADLADRVAFHAWLQRLCDEQLGAVADLARDAGMPIGMVHDLAVGVDPGGADGWMLGDVPAAGASIGAPPDAFNQLGQDWGIAAFRPDRLAETGYAAYRDLLRRVLRHAGGLRVDHVAGLFRLWWIPPGASAADGTYVHYDADAMLGILALEALRAGAVVIGEDLGTIQPAVTRGLRDRNMLGSTVLWFARDWAKPNAPFLLPKQWPTNALASISTHDLPTAAGFLAGDHVRTRAELRLLTSDVGEEQRRADADRDQLLAMLRSAGLLAPEVSGEVSGEARAEASGEASAEASVASGAEPSAVAGADARESAERATAADSERHPSTVADVVLAMHEALAVSPSRLIAASPYDVLGDMRQPNMPGTTDQYPNWRLPLTETLEEIVVDPRVSRVAEVMAASRPRTPPPSAGS